MSSTLLLGGGILASSLLFALVARGAEPVLWAVQDPATGQIDITDAGQPVLCYHCEAQYQQPWDRYQERSQ